MLSWTVLKIDFAIIILTTLKKIEVQHRGRAEQSDQIPFEEHVLQGRWTSAQAFRQTWSKGSQRNLLQLVRLLCGQIHALWIVKLLSPWYQHHQTVLFTTCSGCVSGRVKGFSCLSSWHSFRRAEQNPPSMSKFHLWMLWCSNSLRCLLNSRCGVCWKGGCGSLLWSPSGNESL